MVAVAARATVATVEPRSRKRRARRPTRRFKDSGLFTGASKLEAVDRMSAAVVEHEPRLHLAREAVRPLLAITAPWVERPTHGTTDDQRSLRRCARLRTETISLRRRHRHELCSG